MSSCVHVALSERAYDILIGSHILDRVAGPITKFGLGKKAAIITDSNVAPHFLGRVKEQLESMGIEVLECIVPAGESSKNLALVADLLSRLANARLERTSFIIALGGGVVGDLSGFVASIYLRGIPFIQIPTTLLAQVDSSVGGKTGVNLPEGKNLVGCFYQPRLVLIDPTTLNTLPDREFRSGLAEVVKYGVIQDEAFFSFITENSSNLLCKEPAALNAVIARCCQLKADVVVKDEREELGLREILNFGHTIGHAIENAAGYGEFLHGEAISIGMVYEAVLSESKLNFPHPDTRKLIDLLKAFALPVSFPLLNQEKFIDAMYRDKKVKDGKIRFVLAEKLGSVKTNIVVSAEETLNALKYQS
ncbi:MAG: 3-dehydroquinate synthase [Verrucomicrobiota bacterium]|nr:3-dehydroquinate synthase [Verrucomicrobiota bacterium]